AGARSGGGGGDPEPARHRARLSRDARRPPPNRAAGRAARDEADDGRERAALAARARRRGRARRAHVPDLRPLGVGARRAPGGRGRPGRGPRVVPRELSRGVGAGGGTRRGRRGRGARLGAYLYGEGTVTLEEVVGGELRERRLTLALAESCTAGLVAHRVTNVPGSSAYFLGGVVAYANAAKEALLGVPRALLERHG